MGDFLVRVWRYIRLCEGTYYTPDNIARVIGQWQSVIGNPPWATP